MSFLHAGQKKSFLLFMLLLVLTYSAASSPIQVEENGFIIATASSNSQFHLSARTVNGKKLPINAYHNWLITLTDQKGHSVYPAYFSLDGGMPSHGHGLPTQPMVTRHVGDGTYLLEGVKFNMYGDWQLKFLISANNTKDTVVFDFEVNY